ncbi:MAG: hemerythrin family protein [Candidatus Adiutrix sp.]|jgi:hemerythrin|nr:hemerythrin family protein [Candidatus Adiutrix sp.]
MLWTAALETGIPKIDQQHQALFRQADILMDASQKDRIPDTLDFLGRYVFKHFNDEEVMHAAVKYPKAATHKEMHRQFITTFKNLKKKYEESKQSLAIAMEINKVVVGWLKEHIMVQDKDFARYYQSRG